MVYTQMKEKLVHIGEAAKSVGVHAATLRRWFKQGKINEMPRDRNNRRVFSEKDIRSIKNYANQIKR